MIIFVLRIIWSDAHSREVWIRPEEEMVGKNIGARNIETEGENENKTQTGVSFALAYFYHIITSGIMGVLECTW